MSVWPTDYRPKRVFRTALRFGATWVGRSRYLDLAPELFSLLLSPPFLSRASPFSVLRSIYTVLLLSIDNRPRYLFPMLSV